uniref:Uncharacterized protein n=1 Tax=Plectus sambesii TaxID=2011161 RepID=A0A914VWY3_9BILA
MVGPDSEGIWYLLYQFYQLVVLVALVGCGFVAYLISTQSPRKQPIEEEQKPVEANVPEEKVAAVVDAPAQVDEPVDAMVRNRSETLLMTKELHEKMAEEFQALHKEREKTKSVKAPKKITPSFEADADDEEEEEEEEEEESEVVEPAPTRRRRIIGEVTVQKVVLPTQSQYSDSQITAAREMIRRNIDRKLTTGDEQQEEPQL